MAIIVPIAKYQKPAVADEEDDFLSLEELERLNQEKDEKLKEERRKHNERVAKTYKLKPKKP